MRGKDHDVSFFQKRPRITPAYAGKSLLCHACLFAEQDHPRLCGEKSTLVLCMYTNMGSPPPMRGKGVSGFSLTSVYRITPAYAGKSAALSHKLRLGGDHPRLCGEKFKNYVDLFHDKGSPPPMRGKVKN